MHLKRLLNKLYGIVIYTYRNGKRLVKCIFKFFVLSWFNCWVISDDELTDV